MAFCVRAPVPVRQNAPNGDDCGRYFRSVGQGCLPSRHRFPVRAVFSHRCGCLCLASTLNSFLPEHSVPTCRPTVCRSRLWATSCGSVRRVRAADCHHLPISPLRGTQHAEKRAGSMATRSVKCEILREYWWEYPRQRLGPCMFRIGLPQIWLAFRSGSRQTSLHRSCVTGLWPGTAGKLY